MTAGLYRGESGPPLKIVCVKAEGDVFPVARWLVEHGFSVEVTVAMSEPQMLCAKPSMNVQGLRLPDELRICQGEVLIAGLDRHERVRAVGVLPAELAEPILRQADVIL